ncbi:unnamed protein product [Albugo candida]|uniref:Inositol oxygenase n=1 Tax=Albugo candida TaxID=65357 RepID=A0A024GBJ9_9STRA|nr:unnamed protein product [Albugo candida]CCI44148.1 unnamed protein product [Albugo candida]|eukprot:CCI42687.1 unnamed protein product [Albugo candida]
MDASERDISKVVFSAKEKAEPGKSEDEFRNYEDSCRQATVKRHYKLMRQHQTMDFYRFMEAQYGRFRNAKMTVWEAFEALEGYVDSSDPDSSLPNLEHMLQTAEGIRAAGHPDWFQLVGLLHDMGKIQYLWGTKEVGQEGTAHGDQWALGGDTWVLGCRIPDSVVFSEYNALNPDMDNDIYCSRYGIYSPGCGMANLKFTWGHDEYMYRMLMHNKTSIPEEGLAMIRYHSCYAWHKEKEYQHLMNEDDHDLIDWVLEFNKFDLYTKADIRPNVQELWPYYQSLIDKYIPGELYW